MRVLVVDDSVAFRTQIKRALDALPGITEVVTAANGKLALQQLEQSTFGLMTLDLNMPVMGGLEVLEALKGKRVPRVLVFASESGESARAALHALRLGAVDVVVKPVAEVGSLEAAHEIVARELEPKVRPFLASRVETLAPSPAPVRAAPVVLPSPHRNGSRALTNPAAIVIASSTGGPSALETLLTGFPGPNSVPILIAQHMPPLFTKHLAQRLSDVAGIDLREGVEGEPVVPGRAYIAPGDVHMKVVAVGTGVHVTLDQSERVNSVRPAADLLFETAAKFWSHRCLAFVLTGMGEDGARGGQAVRAAGGAVLIQDKESSVVWGMPGAVHALGAYDGMADIKALGAAIERLAGRRKEVS
jgi:two-component system chemotaxis response regulator CheB